MLPTSVASGPKKKPPVGSGVFKNPAQAKPPVFKAPSAPKPRPAPSPPKPAAPSRPSPARTAAVTRRASTPVQRAPAPKPPPVVVPNRTGKVTTPKPPPPVRPGKVQTKTPVATPSNVAPAAAPVAPTPPDINTWLGTDAEYIQAMNDYDAAQTDFDTANSADQSTSDSSFASRYRDLQSAQKIDQGNLEEQMAGRGMLKSGVYSDALSNLNQGYTNQSNDLTNEQTAANAGITGRTLNIGGSSVLSLREQARQDAIARRAAQYGL